MKKNSKAMATVLKCTLRIFMLNGGFYETCQNGVLRRAVTSDEKAKMKADIQHYANLAREVLNGVDITPTEFKSGISFSPEEPEVVFTLGAFEAALNQHINH